MDHGIIFGNRICDIVLVALISAQTLKVLLSLFKEKRINFHRFLDTGNMPSSHTASVVSLTTAVAFKEGIHSTYFVICLVLAIVVMYDATGVRRAAGKQAAVLNKIVENLRTKEGLSHLEGNLKELLGHTPLEVLGGAILGVLVAFLMS
ncbi:MAG TPA: divergent PAP2 family protein [Candidatus Cloacimonadota bacterium]|nr:divergent PAP2 family protein [Candidatus Cloacimonadota bacterium]